MRSVLDLVKAGQLWTLPPRPDRAAAARQVLHVHSMRIQPDCTILELAGEIDMLTTWLLAERLDEHLSEEVRLIVLDLSDVTFLSAGGLNVLVIADDYARARGVTISITGCGGLVRVFEMAGLRERFHFVADHQSLVDQC
ncbi:STAS domain-containing protein [Lentzea sp. NEAU-D7]|uniref:STAS domain-containing protein n=1 Tax=Lentzea sp. NEAU-D7 TaxID=2994667 RepID=UPI00224B6330|nr:STAS domain-containing protein [Lentzea sp. NEAU-D7]MCX2948902.1 STAS domain-containing protein [Lentzea sp. NEAU-D7]